MNPAELPEALLTYDGETIRSVADVVRIIATKIGTRKQADQFMDACVKAMGPNKGVYTIGYACGEFEVKEADRLLRLFGIHHPFAMNAPRTLNGLIGQGMQLGALNAREDLENEKFIQIIRAEENRKLEAAAAAVEAEKKNIEPASSEDAPVILRA